MGSSILTLWSVGVLLSDIAYSLQWSLTVGTGNFICMVIAWRMNKLIGWAYLKSNGVADQLAD